jgi:NAD(P)-dependent dehydrogenase (short-subunit alcohol dehydrogenase family)
MTITLITGANKGLGYEAARRLIGLGHTVLAGARDRRQCTLRRWLRHRGRAGPVRCHHAELCQPPAAAGRAARSSAARGTGMRPSGRRVV